MTLKTRTADTEAARSFDLHNVPEEYFDNPYPYFRMLRNDDPVHLNSDGSVLLTQYADVRQVWRDISGEVFKGEQFRQRFGEGPLLEHHTSTMLFRDQPDHDRLRNIVNPFFSQASIQSVKGFIEETVEKHLDVVAEKRDVDFVSDFAFRLPVAVICKLIGVPVEDADYIQGVGRKVLFPLNPAVPADAITEGHEATAEFKSYLRPFLEKRQRSTDIDPMSDVLSAMVAAQRNGVTVSDDEILHMCIVTLNGGHETTTNLISQSIHYLLDDPEAMAQMRNGDVPVNVAIEELVRFITPLQLQGRRVTRDIELDSGNGTIPKGTEVIICQASANRDERVFDNPEKLNLARKPNNHMGFGAGIHVCIGRPLARLEASVAVPAVLRRFKTIERTGPAHFNHNTRFRGLADLPLRLA
ncbi:cytochrome P450 [Salipiger sp. P9]|uniref:cytochrome P450 n=1 Tax=Salipiger pentaromativorans TaxID=2943193 RepID=UPI002157AE09|nr:cytochrome P450 [Salipiger pentaromativorans]MCR8551053.1 cytochrome P450 [Salipiger pentaromativorans]